MVAIPALVAHQHVQVRCRLSFENMHAVVGDHHCTYTVCCIYDMCNNNKTPTTQVCMYVRGRRLHRNTKYALSRARKSLHLSLSKYPQQAQLEPREQSQSNNDQRWKQLPL
jgi:hypothetical protein